MSAEGELDVRGTLGVDREAPVGFRAIRLRFDVETRRGRGAAREPAKLTERYCVVLQTIQTGVPVASRLDARA